MYFWREWSGLFRVVFLCCLVGLGGGKNNGEKGTLMVFPSFLHYSCQRERIRRGRLISYGACQSLCTQKIRMEAPVWVGTENLSRLDYLSKMVLFLNPGVPEQNHNLVEIPRTRIRCFILCSKYLLLFFFLFFSVFLLTINRYNNNIHSDGRQRGSHACTVTASACRALLSGLSLWKVFPLDILFFLRIFCSLSDFSVDSKALLLLNSIVGETITSLPSLSVTSQNFLCKFKELLSTHNFSG